MTVVEKRDSPAEGTQQGEEIDVLDHGALIEDMNKSDKLSLEERARKARKNRHQQLKLFSQYDRAEEERTEGRGSNRSVTIRFPHDVALMDAAAKGAVDDMKNLLEKGLDPNAKNQEGLTALHNSCIDGNPEIVNLLLEHGASVNVSDKDGWTPLHAAATCGYPTVVKSLIAAGADLLAINGDGDMPYDIADDEETLGIIEDAMRTKGVTNEAIEEKRTELHSVILADIKALIDENENLDMPVNEEGATLLHVAISNNFNDVVELLLDNGASVDTQDIEGWKPVHAAAFFGNEDALEMLVMKKGADLRAATDSGLEPLDLVDQPTVRKNILTLMNADQNKYKVENKKPIERGSTTPQPLEEALSQDESTTDKNINILPIVGESTGNEGDDQVLRNLAENKDFMPVLKRVESISTKRNSMREAKKQAPTIKSSNITRKDSLDVYDNSYDLLLTKKKPDQPKSNTYNDNELNYNSVQTLGKIYESDDRSEDLSVDDQITVDMPAISSEENIHNDNEPASTSQTINGGATLQISAEYGALLRTQSKPEPRKPVFLPPAMSSTVDIDPIVLPVSPFEDESSPNLNDGKNDLVLPSETDSMVSTTRGDDFLGELKRSISPKMATPHAQDTGTSPYESDLPTQSKPEENPPSTSAHESSIPSTLNYESDLPPASVYDEEPSTNADQERNRSSMVDENTAQTELLFKIEPQNESLYENNEPDSAFYENTLPTGHLYEDVHEVATFNKSSDVKIETVSRTNEISTKPKEPLYAVVAKETKNESKIITEGESTNSRATIPSKESKSSTSSGNVNSTKKSATPNNESSRNLNERSRPPPLVVNSDRGSTVAASPPPVPPRKKFDPLVENRVRSPEPAKPGTLQDLKLKRQKSRQTLLLEDSELSPVLSRSLEPMILRSINQGARSPTVPFRPPDSPTTNRKVFKAPELSGKDANIFTQKKRCNVM